MGLSNPIHIAFVLVLLLLVFGAKRLPEMGRSLGSGMRGFKETLAGEGEPHEATAVDSPILTPALTPAVTPAVMPAVMPASEPVMPTAEPVRHLAQPLASAGRPTTPAA
jgi:sec-independent protein translocase protein TatA